MNNIVKEFLKGILIGVANIIPGVSGGTMAVSMGVYDKIILAITGFRKDFIKSILTLIPYVLGALVGIGALSFVVKYAVNNYPMETSGLFIGLIIGGIPILLTKVKGAKLKISNMVVFVIFFCIVTGMAFLNGNEGSATDISVNTITIIQLFFVGMIASATMIIPGVSGSLVMMILGFYGLIISNISNMITSLADFNVTGLFHGFGVLFPFGIGILVGIGLVAKLIEVLFAKVPVLTYFAIFGLIFGSPIAIIYKIGISTVTIRTVVVTIITFGIGFAVSYFLGKDESNDADILEEV
jgi:putative membrane protein